MTKFDTTTYMFKLRFKSPLKDEIIEIHLPLYKLESSPEEYTHYSEKDLLDALDRMFGVESRWIADVRQNDNGRSILGRTRTGFQDFDILELRNEPGVFYEIVLTPSAQRELDAYRREKLNLPSSPFDIQHPASYGSPFSAGSASPITSSSPPARRMSPRSPSPEVRRSSPLADLLTSLRSRPSVTPVPFALAESPAVTPIRFSLGESPTITPAAPFFLSESTNPDIASLVPFPTLDEEEEEPYVTAAEESAWETWAASPEPVVPQTPNTPSGNVSRYMPDSSLNRSRGLVMPSPQLNAREYASRLRR